MREHEESFLSCVFLDNTILFKTTLTESHFTEPETRALYRAMLVCMEKNVKVDYIAISDFAPDMDKAYPPHIFNLVPSSANWKFYETQINTDFQRRQLKMMGQMLAHIEDAEDPAEYIERAEKQLFELSTNCKTSEVKRLAELVPAALKVIEERFKSNGKLPGLSTGISGLDKLIGGLQDSRYVVIGARPSDGKSALAVNMLCHIGLHERVPVGLISAESSNNEIVSRVFASEGSINGSYLSMGLLSTRDMSALKAVGESIKDAPVYIYDAPNVRFAELRSVARQMVASFKVKVIFVDYIQILQWDDKRIPRHEQVANISMGLKALARELKIPIVGLAQLVRDAEGREPQMKDLGDSGQLEKDADALVLIYHPQKDESDRSPSKLLVKKNRDGAKGVVDVTFRREYVRFYQTEVER